MNCSINIICVYSKLMFYCYDDSWKYIFMIWITFRQWGTSFNFCCWMCVVVVVGLLWQIYQIKLTDALLHTYWCHYEMHCGELKQELYYVLPQLSFSLYLKPFQFHKKTCSRIFCCECTWNDRQQSCSQTLLSWSDIFFDMLVCICVHADPAVILNLNIHKLFTEIHSLPLMQ